MKPIDYRNETWADVKGRMDAVRLHIWEVMLEPVNRVPMTTREIAAVTGVDLLTVRPRVTELYQMGFVEVVDDGSGKRGKEGYYRALSEYEAMRVFEMECRVAREPQLELDL